MFSSHRLLVVTFQAVSLFKILDILVDVVSFINTTLSNLGFRVRILNEFQNANTYIGGSVKVRWLNLLLFREFWLASTCSPDPLCY